MTALPRRVDRFLARFRARLERAAGETPPVGEEALALQAAWPEPGLARARPARPVTRAACAFLPRALAAGRGGPEAELALAVEALVPDLAWTYGYPFDPARPGLGDAIAFADILGERGLRAGGRLIVGLTLIAPGTDYPLHAHPAVELYLVVAGTAVWRAGAQAGPQPPGAFILHPGNLPHAMRTGPDPLLAIFTWRGDLVSPSVFLADRAAPPPALQPAS